MPLHSYAGKVDTKLDHRAYMPAAWRVDDYLEGDWKVKGEYAWEVFVLGIYMLGCGFRGRTAVLMEFKEY